MSIVKQIREAVYNVLEDYGLARSIFADEVLSTIEGFDPAYYGEPNLPEDLKCEDEEA